MPYSWRRLGSYKNIIIFLKERHLHSILHSQSTWSRQFLASLIVLEQGLGTIRYCSQFDLGACLSADWDNGFILHHFAIFHEHLWTKSLEVATFRRSSKWWSTPLPRSLLGRSFAYDTSTPEEPSATGSTCFRTGRLGGFDHSPWLSSLQLWSAKCVYDLGVF